MKAQSLAWGLVCVGLVLAGPACGDDDVTAEDEVGDSTTTDTGTGEGSGSESTSETSADTGESESSTDSSTGTDSDSGSSETDTGTDETDTSSEDTTGAETDTGAEICEPADFKGTGIASDGWGVGDGCDDMWICVSADEAAIIEAEIPEASCTVGGGVLEGSCEDSSCTFGDGGFIDEATMAAICAALEIVPGPAWCVVWGP